MKRLISLFLCTILLLTSLSPPALASKIRDANVIFTDGDRTLKVVDAVATDDVVYTMLRYSNYTSKAAIGRWTSATGKTEILISDKLIDHGNRYSGAEDAEDEIGISHIFTSDNLLYAFDDIDMSVRRLMDEDGNVAVSGILYSLIELMPEGSFTGAFAQEGILYLNIFTPEGKYSVSRVDLATGELLSQTLVSNVDALYPYKDEKLLMIRYDLQNSYDADTGKPLPREIAVLDPITGASEKLMMTKGGEDGGVVYHKETDTLYLASGSEIYALPSGADSYVLSGYMPGEDMRSSALLMGADLYISLSGGMLMARQLDPTGITRSALTIYGGYTDEEHLAVVRQNPQLDIANSRSYDTLDFSEIAIKMMIGENSIDIMTLDTANEPIQRVFKKGYAADLSVYPELMERVSAMNPTIISALTQDGRLYAVPISVLGHGLGYRPSVMEQLGMTEDDLPKTFLELLEFVANFQADYGDEHEDVTVSNHFGTRGFLLNSLMTLYVNQLLKDGAEIRFDTPLFRSLLAAHGRIDFAAFDPYEQYGEAAYDMPEVLDSSSEMKGLFSTNANCGTPSAYDVSDDLIPLILAVEEGKEPLTGIHMEVMMINAQSERMEDAAFYLTAYMRSYGAALSIALYPDQNTPVPNPHYEDEVAEIMDNIEKTKRSLESASEENKAEQEDMLRNLEEKLAASDSRKMLISEDEIALFREKASPYFFAMRNWMENAEADIYTLREQYRQQAIDADTFIREMDKRMNMMRLED